MGTSSSFQITIKNMNVVKAPPECNLQEQEWVSERAKQQELAAGINDAFDEKDQNSFIMLRGREGTFSCF